MSISGEGLQVVLKILLLTIEQAVLRELLLAFRQAKSLKEQLYSQQIQSSNSDTHYAEYLYLLVVILQVLTKIEKTKSREFVKCQLWLTRESERPMKKFIATEYPNIDSPDVDMSVIKNDTRRAALKKIADFKLPENHENMSGQLKYFIVYQCRLKGRIKDAIREMERRRRINPTVSLNKLVSDDNNKGTLENFIQDKRLPNYWDLEESQRMMKCYREFKKYIEEDKDKRLRTLCHRKYSQCNAHQLAIWILLANPPLTVVEIVDKLGIRGNKPRNIIDFFWKKKVSPLLQEIAEEIANNY